MSDSPAPRRRAPVELQVIGAGAALLGVVIAAGGALASLLPQHSDPSLIAAAWLAPPGFAFAVYWWGAQKL